MNISRVPNTNLITECHKRLNKIGKITLENVAKTSKKTRQFLRDNTPVRLKELAQMNCYAADKIKKNLDSKYGRENYVLIAVGRSVSSIVELIGKMGADVKIIPMSGLRRAEIDDIPSRDLYTYKTFLHKIGLSKNNLEKNKNKTYILMDYTYYGRSLGKTEKLLKRDNMLGDAENLISIPISNILEEDYSGMKYDKLFEYCRFKDYSYVGRLNVNELKRVYEKCSPDKIKEFQGNITQGLRKLFWFNVFDCLKENRFKNEMPKAEIQALYVHRLSPKALNNYLNRLYTKNMKEIASI